jgi:hypothetical protein
MCKGPYARVDYNLTLCPLQSRLQRIYHGQPYARVYRNPKPESTLSPSQGLHIWPLGPVCNVVLKHGQISFSYINLDPDQISE